MDEITESYGRSPRYKYSLKKKKSGEPFIENWRSIPSRIYTFRLYLSSIFLPQGYPYSVSKDYLTYQVWDTVQALASSLTGALATEAVLRNAGVGNKDATALAASLAWLLKDGCGMIGRIAFSYYNGSQLDVNSKTWRFMADILNDMAFFIDLSAPSEWFFPLACVSSLLRCVVGVAGSATRNAIVNHQAIRNNLADVSAKDGSQETLVNVIALLLSLLLLPLVSGHFTIIWMLFLLFTVIHLYANYRAVRSVHFDVLNLNRCVYVVRKFLSSGKVPSVEEANEEEPLFGSLSNVWLGCPLHVLLQSGDCVSFHDQFCVSTGRTNMVAFRSGASARDQIHALFVLECRIADMHGDFDEFIRQLTSFDYKTDRNQLGIDEWEYMSE